MLTIAIVLLAFSFLVIVSFMVATLIALGSRPLPPRESPRISLLKPVKNVDADLLENLVSFYELDYGNYEVIFGIDRKTDACVSVIEALSRRYPGITTKIIETGAEKRGNPKVATLVEMAPHATGDIYWVTDSNVRVEPGTLSRLVGEYCSRRSMLVFSPILGEGGRSWGSIFENMYINLFVTGATILTWLAIKMPVVTGKSMLIAKEALDQTGGFESYRYVLAEDQIMAETFLAHGFGVSTNFTWISNVNRITSIGGFYGRISRWAKLRFSLTPYVYPLEILTNPLPLCIVLLPFLPHRLSFFLTTLFLKTMLDVFHLLVMEKRMKTPRYILALFPAIVMLKDLIIFVSYLSPFLSRKVVWRGRNIVMKRGSRIPTEE